MDTGQEQIYVYDVPLSVKSKEPHSHVPLNYDSTFIYVRGNEWIAIGLWGFHATSERNHYVIGKKNGYDVHELDKLQKLDEIADNLVNQDWGELIENPQETLETEILEYMRELGWID